MNERSALQSSDCARIGRVLVAPELDGASQRHDAAEQRLDSFSGRLRIRSAKSLLESLALYGLRRPHRAAPPQLRIVEAVDEETGPHDQVDIHRPVLAVLEGPETIQHQ